jgi:hypothetical protein
VFCGTAGSGGDLNFFAAKVDMWYNAMVSEDFWQLRRTIRKCGKLIFPQYDLVRVF